jgi:integrase/recombinase XerD
MSLLLFLIPLREFYKYLFFCKKTNLDWRLIPYPRNPIKRNFKAATDDDFKKMIVFTPDTDNFFGLRNRLILFMLYSSGARVSELVNLKMEDLNIIERYANIISSKNKKPRMLMWNEETGALLVRYIEKRKKYANADNVFLNYKGQSMRTRTIQRLVKECKTKADIKTLLTPHSFRHGLGMKCIENKMHPRTIMAVLGHKNITSSQVYMDVKNQLILDEYNAMYKKKVIHR